MLITVSDGVHSLKIKLTYLENKTQDEESKKVMSTYLKRWVWSRAGLATR